MTALELCFEIHQEFRSDAERLKSVAEPRLSS